MSFSQVLAKIKENEEIRAKSTPIAMVAPELKQNTEDTEITKTCAVLGCEDSKNLNSDSFFRFPEDPNFRQIWTDLTGRNNWTPTDYSYICVQHFSVDCFECDADNSVVLNSKAVPSLKLPKHVLEVEYIDEETFDNEYEDDYDEEENQDYEMEDEEHLYEEHLEEDHFSEEHNYIQQQQHQIQQDVSNNFQQNVYNIKHLTNGTPNRTTEKPSMSHIIDKKVNHTTEKPTISHITDKKVIHTAEKPTTSYRTDKKVDHTTEKPSLSFLTDKKVVHTTEKPTTSHITDQKVVHTTEKPTTSYRTDKKVDHTTEKPSLSFLTDKKVVHTTDKASTSHITDMKDEKSNKLKEQENLELLKVFTEVQVLQRQATSLKYKLRNGTRAYKRQSRTLARLKQEIEIKKNLLNQRRKKKSRILLSLQDKIREDTNGLVLAMPTRHTDDLKNFASSIYKYSPQAYIYIRNTLRTLLPSTDVLESWLLSGYEPKNVLTNSNMIRVVSELTDTELSCKVSLR